MRSDLSGLLFEGTDGEPAARSSVKPWTPSQRTTPGTASAIPGVRRHGCDAKHTLPASAGIAAPRCVDVHGVITDRRSSNLSRHPWFCADPLCSTVGVTLPHPRYS